MRIKAQIGAGMQNYYEKLEPFLEKGMALTTALTLLEWDMETLAPEGSGDYTSHVVGVLSDEYFNNYMNSDVKKCITKLSEDKEAEKLTIQERAVLKQLNRLYDELEHIPPQEYRAYSELKANASGVWAKAREHEKFEEFAPVLKDLIEYKKKFAGYRRRGKEKVYDILLEDYEPGFTMEMLDGFFERIKTELVPVVKKAAQKGGQIDKSYNTKYFEPEKQREFCKWIAGYVGFDFNRGVISESAHPFTTNLHNHDVRITDHYYENNLESAIFSMIHESGHAVYEMDITDELTQTLAGGGASMGMHESQSRFYENVIGKSRAFWVPIYPKLKETFPKQLKNVTLDAFLTGMNKSEPGPVRTEADELTYPLHILIRYEIEKMIFEENVKVDELPKLWNEKYKEYLGVEPSSDAKGILQDVHWSGGDFGYFPSYALGSAIAAQIYYHMQSVMPLEKYLEDGNITAIREYLRDKIHKYGMTKDTNELLRDMMNEEFNPDYYIRYLKEKFE